MDRSEYPIKKNQIEYWIIADKEIIISIQR